MEKPSPPIASQIRTAGYSVKLEALRGLAALMVVGYHAFPSTLYSWMHVFFNGRAAVSLFFVLSGYVLGLSLRRGKGAILHQYLFFMNRRVLRIYPAYFVTGIVFWVYWMQYPFSGETGPLMQLHNLQLSRYAQLKSFCFLDQSINPVTWSLKVEMIGSMALPILHFLTRKSQWPGKILMLLVLLFLGFAPGSGASRMRLYMFYLGYLIVDLEHFPKLPRGNLSVITGLCLITFLGAVLLGESFFGFRFGLLIEATSAAMIILCIQARGGSLWGMLDHAWSHFAGRVSYSVFLVHLVILDVVINLVKLSPLGIMPERGLGYLFYWLGLLVSIPIVMVAAKVLYRWIEKPFINLSKAFPSPGANRKVVTP